MFSKQKFHHYALAGVSATVLAFGMTGQVNAQQTDNALTLSEVLAIGVMTNPEYGGVAASRRATDEELKQGRALYYPSVDANADAGFEHSDDPGTRNDGDGDDDENLTRYDAGITLTQLLFDGWDTRYEIERQKARVTSSANRVRETAELVGLDVVEAYLEVLRQRQLLLIARNNVEEHLEIQRMVNDNVNAGRSTQADMEQIKARLASARANEASTREDLRDAESQYRREVGDAPGDLVLPKMPVQVLESDLEEEVKVTLENSPTLDIYTADIEVAYAESMGTRSSFYPQFDLQLNARNGHDLNGVEGRDTSASALVVMNWNLYRGGADMARSREFIHRHQQAKEARAEAARAVEDDVRQTWASMEASSERARQFARQADANVEVVNSYRDQFTLGRRTLLDVLDAQNELFVSRSNTVNSEFLEMFALYRLLALKGNLFPTLGVEYPNETALAKSDTWNYEERKKAR